MVNSLFMFQLRIGLPPNNSCGLEDVLYDYGVDLALWAHEHNYERLFPLYHFKVRTFQKHMIYVVFRTL